MGSVFYDLSIYTARKGNDDFPRHSEASIIEIADGSLLMAWQRHEKSAHGSGDEAPSTIALANSYDNGKTWVNERTAVRMDGKCVNVYSPSLLRRKDGSIVLFFKRYTHLVWLEPIEAEAKYIFSYDEGKTWSDEYTLWDEPLLAINASFKRISDTSVICPTEIIHSVWGAPDENSRVVVLRSEDDFKTYTKSNMLTAPKRGLMEPCVSERSDGTLNMVMRTQMGSVYFSESEDGGRTWTEARSCGLTAPESCPCIVSVPESDAQIAVWNNNYNPSEASHCGKRTPLTMAISTDGLRSFTDFINVEDDPDRAFTNPSIMITSTGLFVMNYWTCQYNSEGRLGGPIDLKIATFRVDL